MAITSDATEAEFQLMLADVGVPVTVGAVSSFGLLDYDDSALSGESGFASSLGAGSQKRGEIIGRTQIVTLLTSEFEEGDLAIDKRITVDGADYVIRLSLAHSHMALNLTSVYLGKN